MPEGYHPVSMLAEGSVGSRLRLRRAALGLTQAELAERAGISERAVSDIERGLRRVVYRDTARRLVEALELTGAEALEFEAAARGRPSVALEASPPITPTVPRTPLIGRAGELKTVTDLLLDPEVRLVSLVGPGGVGKTRVALQLAGAMTDAFEDGVVFVSLGDLRSAAMVLPAIAGVLKARGGGGTLAALAGHLRDRRMLLVLDTLEHVLAVAPALAELVAMTSACKVLVTSRSALNIRAERAVPIPPLPEAEAVEMFVTCVAAIQVATPAGAVDEALATDICRRLDGLPLAIELAAARTSLFAPSEIRDHLDRRLQLLVGGPVDLPERQRSIEATVAWSYDLLGSEARRLLEQLSVFAGGWTLESAGDVCDAAGDLLASLSELVQSSLVQRETQASGSTRYRMLDTVRAYAAARLGARVGPRDVLALERRHAGHFRALAEDAEPHLRAAGQQAWANRLATERDNLRAALSWAMANAETELALAIAGALWMFWRLTGAFAEGRTWTDQALAMNGGGAARAKALWGAGWLAYQQEDFAETSRRGEELSSMGRAGGDRAATRNGVTLLGQARLAAGDFEGAARHFDEALGLAREGDSAWLLAASCLNRAVAAEHAGELDTARPLLAEAERLYRELGDERFVERVWLQLAYVALLENDVTTARDLVVPGLSGAAERGDRWAVAEQLDAMAAVLAAGGRWRAAAITAGAADVTWESIGAARHPAERLAVERYMLLALAAAGGDAVAAGAEGRRLGLDEAAVYALTEAATLS